MSRNKGKYRKRYGSVENLKEALRKGNLKVSLVATILDVSIRTVNHWLETDEEVQEAWNDVMEEKFDKVEQTHEILMFGIPKYETDITSGKQKQVGWEQLPYYPALKDYQEKKMKKRGWGVVKQETDVNINEIRKSIKEVFEIPEENEGIQSKS